MSSRLYGWRVQSGRVGKFRFYEDFSRHFLWTYRTLHNALAGAGHCPNIFAEAGGEGVSGVVEFAAHPCAELNPLGKGGSGREAHKPALIFAFASAPLGIRKLDLGVGGAETNIFLVLDHDLVSLHLVHLGHPRGESALKDVVRILADRRESHLGFHVPFLCCRFCKREGS